MRSVLCLDSQARELQERAHVAEEPDGACIKRKKVRSPIQHAASKLTCRTESFWTSQKSQLFYIRSFGKVAGI